MLPRWKEVGCRVGVLRVMHRERGFYISRCVLVDKYGVVWVKMLEEVLDRAEVSFSPTLGTSDIMNAEKFIRVAAVFLMCACLV